MSYMRKGRQVHPDDLMPAPLSLEDAWWAARSIVHNEQLPAPERVRLVWAIYDAAEHLPEEV